MAVETDIRVLVPQVRRKLEGAGAPPTLTDDAVKALAADSISAIILYTGSLFGKTLNVTHRDDDYGAPDEWATSDELTPEETVVVSSQAALDYFFFQFGGLKTSERISDEAGTWEYSLSASLLKAQLDLLIKERDRALDALTGDVYALDSYTSFIAVRDAATSMLIEPWVEPQAGLPAPGVVLQPDYRFGGY